FIRATFAFRNALDEAKSGSDLSALNALAASVSPVLDFDERDRLVACWSSPSLLAFLAKMAIQDLAAAKYRRIRCENPKCAAIVLSSHYKTRFCKDNCRETCKKRRQRKRRKTREIQLRRN